MNDTVLVIEDDPSIQLALRGVTAQLGYACEGSLNGKEGLKLAQQNDYKLVILDLELPDMGGIEICRRLRESKSRLPIIILTARNDELSRVLGLELGADDYVCKPFSVPELTARIRTLFRRIDLYSPGIESTVRAPITIGELKLDIDSREISKNGVCMDLSRTEFDVLAYFFTRPGIAVTRDELTENVWGYNCTGFDATVTTYLSRIRHKIETNSESPVYLTTLRGVGYRFIHPDDIDETGTLRHKTTSPEQVE